MGTLGAVVHRPTHATRNLRVKMCPLEPTRRNALMACTLSGTARRDVFPRRTVGSVATSIQKVRIGIRVTRPLLATSFNWLAPALGATSRLKVSNGATDSFAFLYDHARAKLGAMQAFDWTHSALAALGSPLSSARPSRPRSVAQPLRTGACRTRRMSWASRSTRAKAERAGQDSYHTPD